MPAFPTLWVSGRLIDYLRPYCAQSEIDLNILLEDIGLPTDYALDLDTKIPFLKYVTVLNQGAQKSGDRHFGLNCALATPRTKCFAYHFHRYADSLGSAFETYGNYFSILTNAHGHRTENKNGYTSCVWTGLDQYPDIRHYCDLVVAAKFLMLSQIAGDGLIPVSVDLVGPQSAGEKPYRNLFKTHCRFGQKNAALHFRESDLSHPLPTANRDVQGIFLEFLATRTPEPEFATDTLSALRRAIRTQLKDGMPTIASASMSSGLKLADIKTSLRQTSMTFPEFVDNVREEMARHYLLNTGLQMTEIAFNLGFSEPSAFSRAARKWFGSSPSEYRDKAALTLGSAGLSMQPPPDKNSDV